MELVPVTLDGGAHVGRAFDNHAQAIRTRVDPWDDAVAALHERRVNLPLESRLAAVDEHLGLFLVSNDGAVEVLQQAQLRLGDNSAALTTLLDASRRYQNARHPGNRGAGEIIRQGYRFREAEAVLLAGIAGARLGRKEDAKNNIMGAIATLESMRADATVDSQLRSVAAKTLEYARRIEAEIK